MLNQLKNNVVAVVRMKDTKLAKAITENVIEAGFRFIELTLTIENAPQLIKDLNEKYADSNVYIGAGTVVTLEQCKEVVENGAKFVVSPYSNFEIIDYCTQQNVQVLPGIGTVTEAYNCYAKGCEVVKVFPGNVLGPDFIKSALAPLPQIKFMPSGGVSLGNMEEWFAKGAYAVSIGSDLYTGITFDNLDEVKQRAKNYLAKLPK